MTTTVPSKSSKKSNKSAAKGAPESSPILVQPPKPEPVSEPVIPTPPDSKGTGTTRDAKLPKARKMEQKVNYVRKCLVAVQRDARGWDAALEEALADSLARLNAAVSAAGALPDTFQPPKAAPGQGRNVKPLAEGDAIDITDKAAPTYADVLDAAELKGLTVTRVIGAKVAAKTASGTKVVLPRGHVVPAKAA